MVLSGDVSQFAGQAGELRFTRTFSWYTLPYGTKYPQYGDLLLDYIRFSTTPLTAAPVILTPPASQWTHIGATAELTVSANGYPAPVYQWWFNGTNAIIGATNPVIELTNVQASQFGAYTVVITNVYGIVTSPPAILSMDPSIFAQPQGQSVDAGQTISFSVQAVGTGPLSYQWLKNAAALNDGGRVSGAQTATLTVSNVLSGDAGGYSVIVSNGYGTATSQVAILTVRDPVITAQPVNHSVGAGGTISFTASAAGTPPLMYQWLFNGSAIAGASSSNLQLTNIQFSESGAYSVIVTNVLGSATSAPALLSVFPQLAYTVLDWFTGHEGFCPWGSLVSSGTTLYGTTRYGFTGYGTVFKVNMNGSGYTTLHNFAISDGADPIGALVLADTTLYGTANNGGIGTDPGTVFKINTDGSAFTLLREFTGGDGRWPHGDLVLSGTTLYGTTSAGGTAGNGTVFKINTDGSGYTVLHNFTGYPNDGRWPDGSLTLKGTTLYGATPVGGSYGPPEGYGILFKVEIDGSGYTVLKQFTGSDGIAPTGGFVSSGTTLYGIAEGGYSADGTYDRGVVFKINTDGSGYTVLHNFAGPPSDGAVPYGGLVSTGTTLYGITTQGGSHGYSPLTHDYGDGTIFKINTDGSGYSLLKEFTGEDGLSPYAGLLLDGTTLYGTTSSGGISNNGVVFSLSLPFPNLLTPPATQTAEKGSSAAFTVRAEDDPSMIYQWFFNGTNVISGATTNSSLHLTNVQPSQGGAYTVVLTNAFGAVTSAPAMLSVIPAVERRMVPALTLMGQPGGSLNLQDADALGPSPNWVTFDNVALTNTSQWYFDLSTPLPPQRFYRAWQPGPSSVVPVLDLHLVPALTLTGTVGSSVRVDCINQFGPTDAWVTLDTVTLTNTSQLYFDVSAIGQPPRLWRLVPVP